MDSLTHGVLGALAAVSIAEQNTAPTRRFLSLRSASCISAALLPDLDYLLFWIDPLYFLAYWHRGITHSLLMLPIWSLLLSLAWAGLSRHWQRWRQLFLPCALGLASHIAADLLTAYGVQLLAPLSSQRYALSVSYVVDPLFTGLTLIGLLLAWHYRRQGILLGWCLLALYLGAQGLMKQQALSWATQSNSFLPTQRIHALPQPFGPQNWKLVAEDPQGYRVGHLCLGVCWNRAASWLWPPWLAALATAYQPKGKTQWQAHAKWGPAEQSSRVIEAWKHPKLTAFRDFAGLPGLYRIDEDRDRQCVWFTDYRYVIPTMQPFFRYGLCRQRRGNEFGAWERYRLRRFTDAQAQSLE